MSMRKIYRKIARENGVSVKEEKEEKESAEKEVEEKYREEAQEPRMGFSLERTDYKKR